MEKIDCFFNLFTTFSYLKLKTFHSFFKFQWFKLNIKLLKIQFQGGQNFYEKIRTFSGEIRTIRTIFEKKIRTIRTIFEKKIRTIRTFFLNKSVQFSKKSVQSVQLSKKIPAIRTFKKNNTIFENIIQHCLSYKT